VSFVKDRDDHEAICLVPPQTLRNNAKRFTQLAKEHRIPLCELTRELVYPVTFGGLLMEEQVRQLNDIIIHRDEANNGMGRAEIILLVQEFAQLADVKKAENHYDYLIKNKHLTGLKHDGRVSTAQKTSSKRCQITVEQQLWWHMTVDDAHAELHRLNQPTAEFDQLSEYFIGNFDESCFMASDGVIKIVGSLKSKTEKKMDDCRASITSLRLGICSGDQGPFIFLTTGKSIDGAPMKDLDKNVRIRLSTLAQLLVSSLIDLRTTTS